MFFSLLNNYPFEYSYYPKKIDVLTKTELSYKKKSYAELLLKLKNTDSIAAKVLKVRIKNDFHTTKILMTPKLVIFLSKESRDYVEDKLDFKVGYHEYNYGINEYIICIDDIEEEDGIVYLNEEILNTIHEIGVKYINGEIVTDEYKENHDFGKQIEDCLKESGITVYNSKFTIDGHDVALTFEVNSNENIDGNQICYEIGLEPSLFTEVSNKNTIILICSCPRVVFEEFFDKNDFDNAKGANKWLI